MNLFFTPRKIPELAHLPPEERDAIWQRSHHKAWRHWQTWLGFVVAMLVLGIGLFLVIFADYPDEWMRGGWGLLLVVIGSGGHFPIQVLMARAYLKAELDAGHEP